MHISFRRGGGAAAFVGLAIFVAGCAEGVNGYDVAAHPQPLEPDQFNRAVKTIRAEPWVLSGRFATWKPASLIPGGIVYLEPGTPDDPSRGPGLISEVVQGVTPSQMMAAVRAQYAARQRGKVDRVLLDTPGMLIVEATYDYVGSRGNVPFRCVARLSPLKDGNSIAVLTYTRAAAAFPTSQAQAFADALKTQQLK